MCTHNCPCSDCATRVIQGKDVQVCTDSLLGSILNDGSLRVRKGENGYWIDESRQGQWIPRSMHPQLIDAQSVLKMRTEPAPSTEDAPSE